MRLLIVSATIILLFFPQIAHSLECWSITADDLKLSDGQNRSKVEPCRPLNLKYSAAAESFFSCYKLIYHKGSEQYVLKGCHFKENCKLTETEQHLKLKFLGIPHSEPECFECTENLCNSAPKRLRASLGIITLIAISLFL